MLRCKMSLIVIDCHWLSLITIDCHWLSLIVIDITVHKFCIVLLLRTRWLDDIYVYDVYVYDVYVYDIYVYDIYVYDIYVYDIYVYDIYDIFILVQISEFGPPCALGVSPKSWNRPKIQVPACVSSASATRPRFGNTWCQTPTSITG